MTQTGSAEPSAAASCRGGSQPPTSPSDRPAKSVRATWVGAGSRVFGRGARPFLFIVDCVAFLSVALLQGGSSLDLLVLLGALLLLSTAGLYRSRLSLSVLNDLPQLLPAMAGALLLAATVGWLSSARPASIRTLTCGALSLVGLLLGRVLAYWAVRAARAAGFFRHVTLVLGAGRVGADLTRAFQAHPEYGVDVIGFIDSSPTGGELPAPLLGGNQQLAALIQEHCVRNVLVAFGSTPERELVDILRTCDRLDCEIFLVPRLFELHFITRDMDSVWGVPLVRVRRAPYRTASWRIKRLLDVGLATVALVLLLPLMCACALAVRWELGRGVLFRQTRVGLDGRPFELLKFRTLRPAEPGESQTRWTISADQPVGCVGRALRSLSLDELPQLVNVLLGDMSLVGPRPERPHFVDEFQRQIPRYLARHRVPAGLTGYAQVHGLRGDTSIEDRARFDNLYIENWSLWGDVKILLRTFSQVLRRTGS